MSFGFVIPFRDVVFMSSHLFLLSHTYGYAVFSDLGLKILFGGTGNGKGIAVNNHTKHETLMKMIEVQAGLGMGVDKYRVVHSGTGENGSLNPYLNQMTHDYLSSPRREGLLSSTSCKTGIRRTSTKLTARKLSNSCVSSGD
jgi:hypothetical protein